MASNLDLKELNYNISESEEIQLQKPVKKVVRKVNIVIKKSLTKLNVFLIASIFILLTVESVIYFHSVQIGITANKLQSDINKMREANDFLKVSLANSKELTQIESIAINALQMKPADNSKISYLPMPEEITQEQDLITNIASKEKRVFVPVGY